MGFYCSTSVAAWWRNNGARDLVWLAWMGINVVLFWTTYNHYKYDPCYFYLHQILGRGLCVSRGSATVLNLNCGLILLPMCRSFLAILRGPKIKVSKRMVRSLIDRCKGFHITCAYMIVIFSVIHYIAHAVNAHNYSQHYNKVYIGVNAAQKHMENPVIVLLNSVPGVTGALLMIVLFQILSSSTTAVRFSSYELFCYTHHLYIIFYILILVHALKGVLKKQVNVAQHTPGCPYLNSSTLWPVAEHYEGLGYNCDEPPHFSCIGSTSWMWICGPMAIYLVDMVFRYTTWSQCPATVLRVVQFPADIVEIELLKQGFQARPGQYVLLRCPQISSFQWHPYTVSKCPTQEKKSCTVHFKVTGDWTAQLHNKLLQRPDTSDQPLLIPVHPTTTQLFLDGPFGSPLEDIERYEVCLCVAGGVGFTPFCALFNAWRDGVTKGKVKRLYLVWVCRETTAVLPFADMLCHICQQMWDEYRGDLMDISLYFTSEPVALAKETLSAKHNIMAKHVCQGRPQWRRVFCQLAAVHPRSTIGVFSSGPKGLTRAIARYCSRIYSFGTTFHSHHDSY